MRRLGASLLAAIALAAAPASAHDSLAPPGARHNWLPKEDWSANPLALRERLLAPWKSHVSGAQLRVLRNHTSRMLTQGHLTQHMFWHPFHSPAFMRRPDQAAHELFGVSIRTYRRLRRERYTEVQIAQVGGRTPAQLRSAIVRHFRMESAMGVRRHLTPPSQAARMLARQLSLVSCWMSKPLPEFDPDIPFGDPNGHHGPHSRDSKIGIVFPKSAAGCWLPLVPVD
jgi:hypothetical protein